MLIRPATGADLAPMVTLEEQVNRAALAAVFPPTVHFPREQICQERQVEFSDPRTEMWVAEHRGDLIGWIVFSAEELLHMGVTAAQQGTGLAHELHSIAVRCWDGVGSAARLEVFEENYRARRFYQKHSWQPDQRRHRTEFPPHPWLLGYERKPNI